jgi:hypothetical protein
VNVDGVFRVIRLGAQYCIRVAKETYGLVWGDGLRLAGGEGVAEFGCSVCVAEAK